MTPQTLLPLVRSHPFCRGMNDEAVELLAGCAANSHFRDGEALFRAHASADSTWLIRSGRVALEIPGAGPVARRPTTACGARRG